MFADHDNSPPDFRSAPKHNSSRIPRNAQVFFDLRQPLLHEHLMQKRD
jgi:hypothetical protein